ncbi:hypothetical protein DY000_02024009, partial [Brassica cretica]
YLFSNEYVNYLITYTFDFQHEELLSYYISFLRYILLMIVISTYRTDVVVSFPLYVQGIQFAFHEENMIRTAVRALTLNVYHVGDESVNDYVVSQPHTEYFSKLVSFFQRQCMDLSAMVLNTLRSPSPESGGKLFSAVDGIEDTLYYFSDVISAGIPDIERLVTDHILQHLTLPLLLPSLCSEAVNVQTITFSALNYIFPGVLLLLALSISESTISYFSKTLFCFLLLIQDISVDPVTSLYLICCILRIVKIKDLANITAATLFCPVKAFISSSLVKPNSSLAPERPRFGNGHPDNGVAEEADQQCSSTEVLNEDGDCNENTTKTTFNNSHITFRETLLQYISEGDDMQAQGSLFVLATLLQTKELEESVLDAFGILPQRKQHKKLLLQSLVGEDSGEEQLFSPQNGSMRDGLTSELDWCLRKLEEQFGVFCSLHGAAMCPRVHRHQVVDALVSLLCRENISAETLWDGGWLLRQLLPYSEAEFNRKHLKMLNDSYEKCKDALTQEIKVIEAPSPQKEPKSVILQLDRSACNENAVSESSFTAGEKLCEVVFVLLHQLKIFSLGRPLPEQPPIHPPADRSETSRATTAGLDLTVPKPGTEVELVDAVPCRIAFERGKERNFSFLALSSSSGVSGWIVLAEESLLKPDHGTVRVTAPLAGCNPRIDEKHPKWLHLRIRPSTLPFLDPTKRGVYEKLKSKGLVDGRWTLAFRDDDSCSSACSMVLHEIDLQCREVERRLKSLFDLDRNQQDQSNVTSHAFSSSTSSS